MKTMLRAYALVLPVSWLLAACTPATTHGVRVLPPAPPAAPAAVVVDAVAKGPTPEKRMYAAEKRYRQALILLENGNLDGVPESDRALEDMEDALHACAQTSGCAFSQLLVSYKRLLKLDEPDSAIDERVEEEANVGAIPEAEVITDASTLLKTDDQKFREMVQMTPAVQAGIRRWLTDMRTNLIISHENYQYIRHLVSPAFAQRGLPEALLFGIMAKESNGRVHSISRSGAAGLMQFMPATGRRFGLGEDGRGFDTRYDPYKAADAAARYLLERLSELGPSIEYWLAAYNGGEGRARQIRARSGERNFWDGEVYRQFPPETQDYVPMVIAAAWLYLHPDEYGLSFPNVDPSPSTLTLARSASIYELTICLGNDNTRDGYMRVLRNLNPSYSAETWIPAGTTLNATKRVAELYQRWCTEGSRADLARQLVESDPQTAEATADQPIKPIVPKPVPRSSPPKSANIHRVAKNETLGAIAHRHRCNLKTLASANNIRAPRYFLKVGQRLRLEGCAR